MRIGLACFAVAVAASQALSGPQIDTVIAYINSLSAAKTVPPKGKAQVLTDAMDIADARKGLDYAREVLHIVVRFQPDNVTSGRHDRTHWPLSQAKHASNHSALCRRKDASRTPRRENGRHIVLN